MAILCFLSLLQCISKTAFTSVAQVVAQVVLTFRLIICGIFLVLLKVIFYFWPFLRAFWGLLFIFSRVLKQILVFQSVTFFRSQSKHTKETFQSQRIQNRSTKTFQFLGFYSAKKKKTFEHQAIYPSRATLWGLNDL